MYKIALIGAGQLGSRHLQAIAKSSLPLEIQVLEPFEAAANTARLRFDEIVGKREKVLNFVQTVEELNGVLDFVIVATNADVRAAVVGELLAKKQVHNLLLEKVLFQKEQDYIEVAELLMATGTKCWVNHPRRMFPFYQDLKQRLNGAKQIHFSVSGGAWGLACNGLHFLDIFEYLTGATKGEIDGKYLMPGFQETKRKGFVELSGRLLLQNGTNSCELVCFIDKSPMQCSIASEKINVFFDESKGWARVQEKANEWNPEVREEKIIHFQSELTNLVLEAVLLRGECALPSYEEAMQLHLKFLRVLIAHINSFSAEQYNHCPIT